MHVISKGMFSRIPHFLSGFICFLKARQFTGLNAIYLAVGLVFYRQVRFPNAATKRKALFPPRSRFLRALSCFNTGWASHVVSTTYQAMGFVFSGKVCNPIELMQTPYNKQNHHRALQALDSQTAARFAPGCFGRYATRSPHE